MRFPHVFHYRLSPRLASALCQSYQPCPLILNTVCLHTYIALAHTAIAGYAQPEEHLLIRPGGRAEVKETQRFVSWGSGGIGSPVPGLLLHTGVPALDTQGYVGVGLTVIVMADDTILLRSSLGSASRL